MNSQEVYDYILDNLTYRFEKVDGKHGEQWCYPEGDSSGRDFYNNIPIQYLSDDRIESIAEEVFDDFEDDFEAYDADWDEFYEVFEEVFYALVDENTGK